MKNIIGTILLALILASWTVQAQESGEEAETETEAEVEVEVEVVEPESEPETEERERRVRRLGDVVGEGGEDWDLDIPAMDMPAQEVEPQPDVSLPDPVQDAELQRILTRRAFTPDDPEVQAALDALMNQVARDAATAVETGDLAQAEALIEVLSEFAPDRAIIGVIRDELARDATITETLAEAAEALADGRLLAPPDQNAVDLYQQVLAIEPEHAGATEGLARTHQAIIEQAVADAQDFDFEAAEELLARAAEIHDDEEAIAQARQEIDEFRSSHIDELDGNVVSLIDEGEFDQAEDLITQLVAIGHDESRVQRLRNSLADARMYGSFEPGQVFQDEMAELGQQGPDMVVVPAGSFMMGSPEGESDRFSNEGPRHRVTFERGFALSRTEISVGDFRLFVEDTGYVTDAERAGQSRIYEPRSGRMQMQDGVTWEDDYVGRRANDDLPVIHVSWNDAAAYAEWLGEQTGRNYRLPSEAEYEYALRAGTQSPYWWGDGSPNRVVENLTGDGETSPTNARWNVAFRRYNDGHWGPAPVGSFEPNPFGLYDMSGNVMAWTEDCWHDSFVRAPGDGTAWVNPGCNRRVIKGGSWSSGPAMSRSAFRLASSAESSDMRLGIRIARDL
jgi:formylglycine-generating enzyme required for sulfatase activity